MHTHSTLRERWGRVAAHALALLLMMSACTVAYAQVEKLTRNLTWVQTTLTTVVVIIFSIFIIAAGVEVGIRHRKLVDVWPLLVGATISGSAVVWAALMIN